MWEAWAKVVSPSRQQGTFCSKFGGSGASIAAAKRCVQGCGRNRKRGEPEQRGVLLFDEGNGNALHPFGHRALVFEGAAKSGVVCNVSKPLRDTAEKKHAIPGGNCQSEISEDIAGNVGKKAKRGRAFRVRCCVGCKYLPLRVRPRRFQGRYGDLQARVQTGHPRPI